MNIQRDNKFMPNTYNKNFDFPFRDFDPRRVLSAYSKEVEEEPINNGPKNDDQRETSPQMLSLVIMLLAQNHLNSIVDTASKRDVQVNKDQKEKLYLEMLTLYYHLTGLQLGKYLHGNQFTLFALKLRVELLDVLPRMRDTWWLFGINPLTRPKKIKEIVGDDCWKTGGLSSYIDRGERFYIRNVLDDEEIKGIDDLKPLLLSKNQDYDNNLICQFLVKSFYLLTKIINLSTPKDLVAIINLYYVNTSAIMVSQKSLFYKIKPVWRHKSE